MTFTGTLEEMERLAIQHALARHNGNLVKVVQQLGIGRTTLFRKLKQYGLR
jgi:transcriptional regulator of acetoin/glycerol metabolism